MPPLEYTQYLPFPSDPGIKARVLNVFRAHNIHTDYDLVLASEEILEGISLDIAREVVKIKKAALEHFSCKPLFGDEVAKKALAMVKTVPSGVKA
ncbi:hypothetical protein EV182_002624 [Spiromyces aspiralis]|uniref:Uncharacterized protein n=1 Tax=Spiromyces aspiralis TaxID=68401 RepID=A0ACC1HRI2_9FUNG|nr:hypothetical protein EV182_002624 [Spiromyces aspiralis]